jgi:hypothetical protein
VSDTVWPTRECEDLGQHRRPDLWRSQFGHGREVGQGIFHRCLRMAPNHELIVSRGVGSFKRRVGRHLCSGPCQGLWSVHPPNPDLRLAVEGRPRRRELRPSSPTQHPSAECREAGALPERPPPLGSDAPVVEGLAWVADDRPAGDRHPPGTGRGSDLTGGGRADRSDPAGQKYRGRSATSSAGCQRPTRSIIYWRTVLPGWNRKNARSTETRASIKVFIRSERVSWMRGKLLRSAADSVFAEYGSAPPILPQSCVTRAVEALPGSPRKAPR